jgi:Domain of unknown function (DUF5666)
MKMILGKSAKFMLALATFSAVNLTIYPALAAQEAASPKSPPSRLVGVVASVQGDSLTIKTDAGPETTVTVGDATRMLQTLPGSKDLSGATPIHLSDLQVGDRVSARATLGDDGKSYTASSVIAMKQADLAQKHQQDREAWQRSGEGGLVKSVDTSAQTVTISVMAPSGAHPVLIHANSATINRRYAPDSIEFDDARPAPLDRIKTGDQLRARGTRSADGGELQADEIVSGTFRNVVATVTSVDAVAGTLIVSDLVAKSPATIRITHNSQLKRLPPMMAEGLAMRLRGANAGPSQTAQIAAALPNSGAPAHGEWDGRRQGIAPPGPPSAAAAQNATAPDPTAEPQRPRGTADLQQALSRAPSIELADLKKGDAIMVVTTEGSPSTPATAVTLLAGVEPMLQASTRGSQNMLSSSWNIGGGAAGGAAAGGADMPQ